MDICAMENNKRPPDKNNDLPIAANIDKSPEELYYNGKLPDHRKPNVAIVEKREPTAYGKEVTRQLGFELAKRGVVIVIGLAIGVVRIGLPAPLYARCTTIAVICTCVLVSHPQTHTFTAEEN